MSRRLLQHPPAEQLLRYSDGELPAREAKQIRRHLEACWQCRVELEEFEKTVASYVHYQKDVFQPQLPLPPSPWADLHRLFDEIDRSPDHAMAQPTLLNRMARVLGWPAGNPRRWVPIAAALVGFAVFLYLRETPAVQAAELLHRAVAAESGRTAKPRLIRIRTRSQHVNRVIGSHRMLPLNAAEAATLNSLEAMFESAHYDWQDPLSAKSYQTWHDQLAEKRDRVTEEKDSFRILTDTSSGELMEATLKLSAPDLRPVEERLEFRNREWVEISEVSGELPPVEPTEMATSSVKPLAEAVSGTPAVVPAEPAPATIGDELHAMAALHNAGADLGDPIDVSRQGGEIVVSGVGIAPQRQQEIEDALASQPRVVVRFTSSPPAQVQRALPSTESASPAISQLQSRIAEQIGGRVYFDQLAAQVLELSDQSMARIYALRRLAERFSPASESQMDVQDRQLLRDLRLEHTRVLKQLTGEMDRALKPVFNSLGGGSGAVPVDETSSMPWQPATERLFRSGRQVEKLLAVMFGAAPGDGAGKPDAAQFILSFAQLRADVNAYAKIAE